MLCKYVLTVDSISYDIPKSCIQNWDEIKFSRKRSGLEGITRTFTSKFQFVGEAYDLILEEYLSKYLASNASITVYTITNSHTYEEFFSCRLDFGSLTYDGNTVSINSIDDSVANIIKANKGTQYEYSGITMATAMLSAITKTPVRADVAMTGEITLRGRVLPIGGLKEKTLAAKNAGIKTICVPKKNEKDIDEISPEIKKGLKIVFVEQMKDVLDVAFAKKQK